MMILARMRTRVNPRAKIAVLCWLATACTYRFTNVAMRPPPGVYSVAIEAVYDTSREVIPHEYLWVELQRAFAASGKVRLTSQKYADALVRAHITDASIGSTGNVGGLGKRDPRFNRGQSPPLPSHFRDLSVAGRSADKGSINFNVRVEIWDLNNKKIIKTGNYSGGGQVRSFGATSAHGQYLVYEEALQNKFKAAAEAIAQRVVSDFLL